MSREARRISQKRLREIFAKVAKTKILVVGDVMLDQYLWGKVSRISPEAPVPVVNVMRESFMCGGAANVVRNVRALGASVLVTGLIGDDGTGRRLTEILKKDKVNTNGLITFKDGRTIQKTRVIAHNQQVVRVDRDGLKRPDEGVGKRIMKFVRQVIREVDAVIIEDYGKGVVTQQLVDDIVVLARQHGIIVTVDPKDGNFLDFSGVTVVTPNHHEATSAASRMGAENGSMDNVGRTLLRKWGCSALLVTCGEDGMILFDRKKASMRIPTVAREVYDVSGAGDTVISAFTTALAGGATLEESAIVSNYAAGIVIGKLGTATTSCDEILAAMG